MKGYYNIEPTHKVEKSLTSPLYLSNVHKPAGYPWCFLYQSVPRNVLQYLFSCVLDPEMSPSLIFTAKAEVSPVDLPADSNRYGAVMMAMNR